MTSRIIALVVACSVVFTLLTCSLNSTERHHSTWRSERCDTTARILSPTILDFLQPFLQADTLRDSLKTTPKVYWVLLNEGILKRWGAVSASSKQARPTNLPLLGADSLSWLDAAYLWTLADQPDYPYDRYAPLLHDTRQAFLVKRDSMMAQYKRRFPQYKLKVQSDLRGAGRQRRHLGMGKSVSPLSQHNFGFANDIGIWHKGRQLQDIGYYKTFLGEIGGKYDLTWGGTFLGFVDPNHVQYFKNSAEMLGRFPELRIEFEPFVKYYKNRVAKMTAAGKAAKIEDTSQLLTVMNQLRAGRGCVCDSLAERPVGPHLGYLLKQLSGYVPHQDIVLLGDAQSHLATLVHPAGVKKSFRLGAWR